MRTDSRTGHALNFYTWHIGDFAQATRGLDWQQQGLYRAMLDEYYRNEQPFKGTPEQIADAIGASTDTARADVAYLLRRFFEQEGDEYRQPYADRLLENFLARAPAREQSKANARARRERYNKQRTILFAALRTKGITPAYNTSVATLRELAQRVHLTDALAEVGYMDGTAVPDASGLTAQAVGDYGPTDPLTHLPINPQRQDASEDASMSPSASAAGPLRGASSVSLDQKHNTAAAVAAAAHRFGINHNNPRDAKLLALIDDGCTLADFENACAIAQSRGKGWAYMLGIVDQRRQDQAREQPREGPKSGDRAANAEWLRGLEALIGLTPKNGGSNGR